MGISLPSGRKIGPDQPTFIVAEVGSNWRNLEDCLHSIAMAKAAGADAVKFQAFTHEALYGRTDEYLARVEQDENLQGIAKKARIAASELPLEWLPKLKEKADACQIELMCTAFSPELVDEVDKYVSIHKVASAELSHVRILERLRDKGKPVILSTGASGRADIESAIRTLQNPPLCDHSVVDGSVCCECGGTVEYDKGKYLWDPLPIVLMHCVAAYPAKDSKLERIEALRTVFSLPVGYSDHTTDFSLIPVLAANTMKACVIEKHFTDIPEVDTPDRPHSIDVEQFQTMVKRIRNGAMGGDPFSIDESYANTICTPSGEERDMLLRHNRRLLATRRIQAGETLSEIPPHANFGIYRSLREDSRGLSPFAIGKVIGRVATRDIEAGEAIGPGDFE
jgi:N,N'-diacetyllegionaminate synthase